TDRRAPRPSGSPAPSAALPPCPPWPRARPSSLLPCPTAPPALHSCRVMRSCPSWVAAAWAWCTRLFFGNLPPTRAAFWLFFGVRGRGRAGSARVGVRFWCQTPTDHTGEAPRPPAPYGPLAAMTHCPSSAQLQQLLTDGLTGPQAEAVEAHVETCVLCQQ